jgi:hypothetical protein
MVFVIPRKKVLIPRHSEVYGRVYSEAQNGRELHENQFKKKPAPANRSDSMFSSETCFGTEFREFASIFVPRNGIPSFFSSEEWFGTVLQVFASIFVPRNGIPSFFLFHGMVQNGIPQVLLLNLSHGTEFRAFFSSGERFRTEFREFYVLRKSGNSAGTNQLFRLFRLPRNNFLLETANPTQRWPGQGKPGRMEVARVS